MSLNDLVLTWLAQNGVTSYPANSFVTVLRDGVELIASWDAGALGIQPSEDDLTALEGATSIALSAQTDYDALIAAGCQIASTGTTAISATYALDQTSQNNLAGIAATTALLTVFPGGTSDFAYPDISGAPVTFPSVNAFKAFYGAYVTYVLQASQTLAQRQQGIDANWPAQPVYIA